MANTEWLTACLLVLAVTLPHPLGLMALGLLPWANQKNIVLVALVSLTGLSRIQWHDCPWLIGPSIFFLTYLTATKRLKLFWRHCVSIPLQFGKNRKLNRNSNISLLRAWIWEAAPFLAIANLHSPWLIVLLGMVLLMLATKQIVPHHYLALSPVIAFAIIPSALPAALIAFLLVWLFRSFSIWRHPSQLYLRTFFGANGAHYGQILEDADTCEEWLRKNTKPDEVIWVNGMENQIYLNAGRKSWGIMVPELTGFPAGKPPRVVVHCAGSADKSFDYTDYEPQVISRLGSYTLLVRK
jgi:hypothetical protein